MVHHFVERIQERPQIGVDLRLQIAGQEAQALAGLDRRTHQHDLADRLPLERRDGHRHGQIGLAGACRPTTQDDVVLPDGFQIAGLARCPRANLPADAKNVDGRLVRYGQPVLHGRQCPADVVGRYLPVAVCAGLKLLENFGGPSHRRVGAGDVDLAVARRNAHPENIANASQVLVTGAKERQQFLGTNDRYA